MTYKVPPKKADPKPRYVQVTDPEEIASISRNGLRDIIGMYTIHGVWMAERHSLDQFRRKKVEFNV